MRETLECAVLAVPGRPAGLPDWAFHGPDGPGGWLAGQRVRLHVLESDAAAQHDPGGAIAAAALRLQRYDACLLPIESATLPWARVALLRARTTLRTPLLALMREVRAPALADLLELGVADFLGAPLCEEELRVRLARARARAASEADRVQGAESAGRPGPMREPDRAYARMAGRMPGALAARVACASLEGARNGSVRRAQAAHGPVSRPLPAAVHHILTGDDAPDLPEAAAGEPFRLAKARMVARFETAYLHRALQRHGGNVTQAARASCKHRRAFWALMRKHRIDAAPYREPDAGDDELARDPAG